MLDLWLKIDSIVLVLVCPQACLSLRNSGNVSSLSYFIHFLIFVLGQFNSISTHRPVCVECLNTFCKLKQLLII